MLLSVWAGFGLGQGVWEVTMLARGHQAPQMCSCCQGKPYIKIYNSLKEEFAVTQNHFLLHG